MSSGYGSGFSLCLTGYNNGFVKIADAIVIPAETLILHYDISNISSYPGSGATVFDINGNSNATLYNTPSYTSGYLLFDSITNEYLMTNTSLGSKISTDVTSIAVWIYPMDNGVLVSERGEGSLSSGWHDSQMEMVSGVMKFGMWPKGYDN